MGMVGLPVTLKNIRTDKCHPSQSLAKVFVHSQLKAERLGSLTGFYKVRTHSVGADLRFDSQLER